MKNLPETDLNLFNLTIKAFSPIIDLLINLSANTKSKYELKYEINDLILKLFAGKYVDQKRRATICSYLDLKFLNHLTDLFTPFELSNLISSKFLAEPSDAETHSLIIKTINKNLFKIDLFDTNYQFRDTLVNFIVKTYLNITKLKNLDINDILDLVKNILTYKSKLTRNNLDLLINSSLRFMIDKMTLTINNDPSISSVKGFDIFICLIELIDLTMLNKSSLEILTSENLSNLFQAFTFYFDSSDKLNPKPDAHKLHLGINLIVLKFSKYVQKILNRYLIMKCDDDEMLEILIRDYFEFLFTCINRPTSSFSLTMRLKLQVLQTISIFWRSLNFRLKRSLFLSELIISRLSQCLMSNFYFKLIQIEPLGLFFNPFANLTNTKSNFTVLFYENCLKLITDVQTVNQLDNDQIKEITLLNLMSFVVKNDKLRQKGNRKSNDSDIMTELKIKNFSNEIVQLLIELIPNSLIIDQLKSIAEYNLIREEEDLLEATFKISIIEKFVLIHDLYKQIDRLEINNRLILNPSSIIEAKRKIQMNLLDDLYFLHKQEKNFLQMSFVRKEQADLLEWNLSKKTESDLKDILYLKSLKKIAIHSLQEKINDSSAYASNLSTSESTISSSTSTFSSTTSITAPSTSSPSIPSTPSSQSQCSTNPKDLINNNSPSPQVTSTNQSTDQSFFTSIQFEICKQLCAYYEKLDENYSKFTRVLGTESKLNNLASNTSPKGNEIVKNNHHGHLYFRVGFFGSCLKQASIRNKYFLYKHHSYDMVSNVQSLIVNKLMYTCNGDEGHVINDTVLLHHNQEPDVNLKQNSSKCYLQVCAVNRLEKSKLIELIDEMNDGKETLELREYVNKYDELAYFYYFDRPFYSRKLNDDECDEFSEGVENLWLERNILITDEYGTKYENLTQFEDIKEIYKILLNPIRNAINDINEKTKEMKNFVIQFTTSNSNLNIGYTINLNVIHNLQPLTMRLLGCLDARVNGGLIKYVRELLVEHLPESKSNKKRAILLYQLYMSIKEQLEVLESGLNIHDRILKEIEIKYKDLKLDENDLDSKQLKNYEHIKHMIQLNIHLIDCFKMIENELNEKWTKFSTETVFQ